MSMRTLPEAFLVREHPRERTGLRREKDEEGLTGRMVEQIEVEVYCTEEPIDAKDLDRAIQVLTVGTKEDRRRRRKAPERGEE